MRRLRRVLHPAYLWDLFRVSDPGFGRLRQGLRAFVSASLAALVLSRLAHWLGVPPTVPIVGTMMAMMGSQLASDTEPRAQRVTTLLLALPAMASVSVGTLVAPHPWLSAALFAVTVFIATFVRRFGPRGLAMGMLGFMAFFVALFFRAEPAQVPALLGAVAIAIGIAYGVRFGLIRDRPERDLRRYLRAFTRTVALVLWRLAELPERPRLTRDLERRLRREAERLNDAALALEDLAGCCEPGLRLRVFDLELAAERVIGGIHQLLASGALPPGARRELREALRAASTLVREGTPEARREAREHLLLADALAASAPDTERARAVARRLGISLRDLVDAAVRLPSEQLSPSPEQATAASAPPSLPAAPPGRGLHPATRQALQATVACVLAMAAGHALSPTRWYWAVITAFVIFVRTRTLGDTLLRGWYRVLGTLLGVVAGLVLARLVSGHRTVEVGAVFTCIFFAFYLIRVSYAWMTFWITTLLSVLYSLLGRFTPGLLYLRLEETLLGAGIGMAIATVLLPERTAGYIRSAVTQVFSALDAYLQDLVVSRSQGSDTSHLLDSTRNLDARLRDLRTTAGPLIGRRVRLAPRTARMVHSMSALVLFARHLSLGKASMEASGEVRARMREAAEQLAGNSRALARALERNEAPTLTPATTLLAEARRLLTGEEAIPRGPASPPVLLHWLARVDDTLNLLAHLATHAPKRGPVHT